jgi:hypothetical protein
MFSCYGISCLNFVIYYVYVRLVLPMGPPFLIHHAFPLIHLINLRHGKR